MSLSCLLTHSRPMFTFGSNMENKNDSAYLESITKQIFEQLDGLEAVPGVPMQKAAPPAAVIAKKTDEHIDPDKRGG